MSKIIKLLKLIDLLAPPGKTKARLASGVNTTVRSIERYMKDDLPELDIHVQEDEAGRFYAYPNILRDIKVSLTQNEADFISGTLAHAHPNHPLTDAIHTKLFFRSSIGKWLSDDVKKNVPSVVRELTRAMKLNRQIEILDYFSAYQGTLVTRKVEPLFITVVNYRYLIAYEAADDLFVNIKIDRIPKVKVLEEKCTKSPDDTSVDIFQMAFNEKRYEVCLLLTSLAYRILVEERPGADDLIEPYENDGAFKFKFSATIATLLPISRFCMGLAGYIKIVESDALKDYLKSRKNDFLW